MMVTTPASMLGGFFLSTAGWILNVNDPVMIAASPFLGGSATLGFWLFYEIINLFDPPKLKSSFALSFKQEGRPYLEWLTSQSEINPNYDFIFKSYAYSHRLPCDITENRLMKFCKIGTSRMNNTSMLETSNGGFKKLTKNQHWSGSFFIQREGFSLEEVRACKTILKQTGQFINWTQGRSGWATSDNPIMLVSKSKRRWYSHVNKGSTRLNKVQQCLRMFNNV